MGIDFDSNFFKQRFFSLFSGEDYKVGPTPDGPGPLEDYNGKLSLQNRMLVIIHHTMFS